MMNYQTRHFLRLIGIVLLIALVFTILPRGIFSSIMFFVNTIITIIFFYILWRLLGPYIRPAFDRLARKYSKPPKKKPPSWYSDRR